MATKTRPDSVVCEVTIPNYYWWSPKVVHSTGSLGSQRVLFRAGCPRKASHFKDLLVSVFGTAISRETRLGMCRSKFWGRNLAKNFLTILLWQHDTCANLINCCFALTSLFFQKIHVDHDKGTESSRQLLPPQPLLNSQWWASVYWILCWLLPVWSLTVFSVALHICRQHKSCIWMTPTLSANHLLHPLPMPASPQQSVKNTLTFSQLWLFPIIIIWRLNSGAQHGLPMLLHAANKVIAAVVWNSSLCLVVSKLDAIWIDFKEMICCFPDW